jgi:hypothetical protein
MHVHHYVLLRLRTVKVLEYCAIVQHAQLQYEHPSLLICGMHAVGILRMLCLVKAWRTANNQMHEQDMRLRIDHSLANIHTAH